MNEADKITDRILESYSQMLNISVNDSQLANLLIWQEVWGDFQVIFVNVHNLPCYISQLANMKLRGFLRGIFKKPYS